ncbi:MAG: molecular chaperone [Hyphomicrobiales bacterium]|jgi:TorA maturation chaperone TorD|nr:molecular chaperone [Hyphomicrobiales bacterium]
MVNSGEVEEMDLLRAAEYGMLAVLLGAAPTAAVLRQISGLKGDVSALGLAHIDLANAAAAIDETTAGREYFNLFIGVGRGELLPYGSYYQTGFLHERPLARVREDLALLGVERAGSTREPEDHVAILCEVMAGLARGEFDADLDAQARFFERHLAPWAARFFADLETTQTATFYKSVGRLGRTFMELESEAFTLPR